MHARPRVFPALVVGLAAGLAAAQGLAARQQPSRQPREPQQQQQAPQQPQFRGEVDVIRLDVSVLDKDRRPVRGLTLSDFQVFEEGKPQSLVAVSEVDTAASDVAPSAWMRYTPEDVAANDSLERAADGRIIALVLDDWNIPWDDLDMTLNARAIARDVIDHMAPSDVAAVVYPLDAGRTVDFTSDRTRLLEAIDNYNPRERPWIYDTGGAPGPGGGDMPQRFSPVLGRSRCQQTQPTVPVLDTVAARLASVPNRRKTLLLVSTGVPVNPGDSRGCNGELAEIMRDVYRRSQQSNINIYSIDPGGYRGYEDYLQRPAMRGRAMGESMTPQAAASAARLRRNFMEITASETGAFAVTRTDEVDAGVDRIFREDAAYYLVGYQTSNGAPDCKYRKIEVKVDRPGVEVRTRAGYYAPCEKGFESDAARTPPSTNALGLAGLMSPVSLPLRAQAIALGPSADGKKTDIGVVLTVRLPPSAGAVDETVTVTRNLYDADGRAGAPAQDRRDLTLPPSGTDPLTYDLYYRLSLEPGRREVRFNVHSNAIDRGGSVYAPVDVPDFSLRSLSLTDVALGAPVEGGAGPDDGFGGLLPVRPTTAREFSVSDRVSASLRFYVGPRAQPAPIAVDARVIDASDQVVFQQQVVIPPGDLDAKRSAVFTLPLPLEGRTRGPHLLSISTRLGDGLPVRRDVVFRVR